MDRTQYRQARRLLRDNGRYALNWITGAAREELDHLIFNIQDSTDRLAERQSIVAYCLRNNLQYNFRQLAN